MAENDEEELLEATKVEEEPEKKPRKDGEEGDDDAAQGDGKLNALLQKFGLSKKFAIIIVASLVLVIVLAIGAYFFLSSSDDEALKEGDEAALLSEEDQAEQEMEKEGDIELELIEEPEKEMSKLEKISKSMDKPMFKNDEDPSPDADDLAALAKEAAKDSSTGPLSDDLMNESMEGDEILGSDEETQVETEEISEETLALKKEYEELKKRLELLEVQNLLKGNDNKEASNSPAISPELLTDQYIDYQSLYDDFGATREVEVEPPPKPKWGEFSPTYQAKKVEKTAAKTKTSE